MAGTPENLDLDHHKLGLSDAGKSDVTPTRGLSKKVVREISWMKSEPDWMLDMRLRSFRHFEKRPMPTWGGDLSEVSFDDISYNLKPTGGRTAAWQDLPAERTSLAGTAAQDEAELVFRRNREELQRLGVIFCDMDTAIREHSELVKPYFGKIVPLDDNKFSALNTSVWSGGSFVYVPAGIEVDQPLQAYSRANTKNMGQFERTLIIADEGAKVRYLEGCSAPVYTSDSLRSEVVEVVVKPNAQVTYTTIQNWSNNVFNLGTKRAVVEAEGHMEWIDGNIGSRLTMKYPSVWLVGQKATGSVLSVAYAGADQHQDTGAKMVHAAPETTSKVVFKSISKDGGRSSYRGLVQIGDDAHGSKSLVQCEALVLDDDSVSDAFPSTQVGAPDAEVDQETTVSKIASEQLFYLMSRGLPRGQAIAMLVNGFIEPVTRTLPIEYAVEWSRLIELQMEGSIG